MDGRLVSFIAVHGDRTLPKDTFILVGPCPGRGNNPTFPGYYIVANNTHPTVPFYTFILEHILRPQEFALRELCIPRTPGVVEQIVELADGEFEQAETHQLPEQKELREANQIWAFKHAAGTSSVSNANDNGHMHSTSHKLAATGNAGQSNHHISACIVAKAETAFETFQKDNPKLNWDPKTIRVRMTHMAHNLPPIIARAFTTSQLQRASANVGYEVFDKGFLRLNPKTMLRQFHVPLNTFNQMLGVIEECRKLVILEGLGELSHDRIDTCGFGEIKHLFSLPERKSTQMHPDDKVVNHRGAINYDKLDHARHKREREARAAKRREAQAALTKQRRAIKKAAQVTKPKPPVTAKPPRAKPKSKPPAKHNPHQARPKPNKSQEKAQKKALVAACTASLLQTEPADESDEQCSDCPLWWSQFEEHDIYWLKWNGCDHCKLAWCTECKTTSQVKTHEDFCQAKKQKN